MGMPEPGCLARLASNGYTHVVRLAEDHEVGEVWGSLEAYEEEARRAGLRVISYPIRDYSVPRGPDSACQLARMLLALAERGARILIHCYGGTGRTPMLVTAVLVACGYSLGEALRVVEEKLGVVDLTPDQQDFLAWFERLYRGCACSDGIPCCNC